jgi:ABC-2 type transport system permease protein
MSSVGVICRKELRDMVRNKLLIVLFALLAFVILSAILVAAIDFHSKVADYQQYKVALKQAGSSVFPHSPELFPLKLLIGGLEYLEIIGALLAIIVGYGMVAKEKTRGTLELLFSRPLKPLSVGLGKVSALLIIWFTFCTTVYLAIVAVLLVLGGATLTQIDFVRLLITMTLAGIYLTFWSALALGIASRTKQLSTALVLALTIWLIVVLILPQIGDTMDPDNQVPGGLFNSLQVSAQQQKTVMSHFSGYESSRNYIEAASVEKHFERAAFGFTGVKDIYNQQSLSYVFKRLWPNMLAVFLWAAAGIGWAVLQCRKKQLMRKG